MTRTPFNPDLIAGPKKRSLSRARGPLTVSQITALVKNAIATALPGSVTIVGEISNFKQHSGGHLYLTLKDRHSEISCVMWRSAAAKMKFDPSNGLEVLATGTVEVFERAGRYQLYIRKLEPRGVGALELAFRQLCEKLERGGLFDAKHKKPLPPFPRTLALVTSPTGAAVGDMLRTIERRYPCVRVFVYPVRVQGDSAAKEIGSAIRRVNAKSSSLGGVDVMIVGRGGGSLEDLWAFNEEVVARAIHASRIPIISAVGHEVDVTIADLVADARAATPTAAGELAVPVLDDVLERLTVLSDRLTRGVRTTASLCASGIKGLLQRRAIREPLRAVHHRTQALDELSGRLHGRLADQMRTQRRAIDRLEPVMRRIAPHSLLLKREVALREVRHRIRWAVQRRLNAMDRVNRSAHTLRSALRFLVTLRREQCRRIQERLSAMSYRSVLNRGFAIVRTKRGRKVIRTLEQVRDGLRVVTEVKGGEFESDVVNLHQKELFD